ncbi:hypothetical protein N0V91_010034 [Didymella pomorum]|uniref:Rhodopsin domain-containing protein n=1 Tax=Didymella pomorum TaxID=749634 RepID=A0A9W9D2G4_9PLEO|nr:hypothetical protein N0V91_010034 [Didymella pomorum]
MPTAVYKNQVSQDRLGRLDNNSVYEVNAGNGKHAIFVSYPEGVSEVLKYLYFSIITYNISLTVTKISILLQYYRIFTLREMRIPVYIALVINMHTEI